MENDYKISIVIPVYNAEDTIQMAIDSIINQTIGFENIELILIDDKSTDNTKYVINKYLDYTNIKYYCLKKNTGFPSIPKNTGIDMVTAPYLMFIDSDDFILKDYCETLYSVITAEEADIVNSKLASKFEDGIYIASIPSKEYIKLENHLSAPLNMCGNIFKTDLIKKNDIKCPVAQAEDTNFSVKAYSKAKKMFQLPNYYGYCYRIENNGAKTSITHSVNSDTINNTINGYKLINEYMSENNLDKSHVFNIRITYLIITFFKFYGSKTDKINMLNSIRDFEMYLDYDIVIGSKIFSIVNGLIINKHYNLVIFLGRFAGFFYKHNSLRNFLYFKFFGLKKLELDYEI